jgi:hypothetical protein
VYSNGVSKGELLSWLEVAKEAAQFSTLHVSETSPLAYAANPITERALIVLLASFDRLIKRAR